MKYKNSSTTKDVVGFELFINWNEPIVLCEGPFDAIAVKRNCIPLFGKQILKSLKRKIVEKKVSTIYISLDTDAISDSLKMVEEFMLLANKIVAEEINEYEKKYNKRYTFVYRIHEDPDKAKLVELKKYIKQFGYSINVDEKKLSSSINDLMKEIKGKPEENSIEKFAIRSMSKARYSTDKEKHFGLAFKNYSHFTSPIRRFPDVMVHRLLQYYINGSKPKDKLYYEVLCKHCSQMEVNATKAERESIKYKQAEFMANFIGEEFDGVITGITEWGIYVEITKTKCEGLVKISSLTDDKYDFDNEKVIIIGRRNKKSYSLGKAVKVNVTGTNIEKRTIDLDLL